MSCLVNLPRWWSTVFNVKLTHRLLQRLVAAPTNAFYLLPQNQNPFCCSPCALQSFFQSPVPFRRFQMGFQSLTISSRHQHILKTLKVGLLGVTVKNTQEQLKNNVAFFIIYLKLQHSLKLKLHFISHWVSFCAVVKLRCAIHWDREHNFSHERNIPVGTPCNVSGV